ncbi:hypothetical protein Hsero_0048 [Herbaspirillum seropedicae SmR1]|uniref:Uncharacterized protein n=1 Tax=Herbaspirillum seropedicae (strain SmR1) TaxID=757424 RepID=D8ITT7_HERSS|nr:hypothetical protein Hsero_0048 [Herbaspirillum seropedicae SmR1]
MVRAMSLISSPQSTFCTKATGPISAMRLMLIWRSSVSVRGPKDSSKMRMIAASSSLRRLLPGASGAGGDGWRGALAGAFPISALASPAIRLSCCTCRVSALISASKERSGICSGMSDPAGPAGNGFMLFLLLRQLGSCPNRLRESIGPTGPPPRG